MAKHAMTIGGGIGIGAVSAVAIERLIEHGDLGILVFGVLALGAMFFGWLSSRAK